MDVTISNTRFKNYLKRVHDFDLTNRIGKVTNWMELPQEFEAAMYYDRFSGLLSLYGPMYYIKGDPNNYMCINKNGIWSCNNKFARKRSLSDVYLEIGLPEYLYLTPDELYEIYK